jgi:hypothetical protein
MDEEGQSVGGVARGLTPPLPFSASRRGNPFPNPTNAARRIPSPRGGLPFAGRMADGDGRFRGRRVGRSAPGYYGLRPAACRAAIGGAVRFGGFARLFEKRLTIDQQPFTMRSFKSTLLLALLTFQIPFQPAAAQDASELPALRLTGVEVSASRVTLEWAGGRPTYLVQSRASLDQNWSNVGTPTTANTVEIPLNASQAFFRVLSDYTAQYEVVFDASWSQVTHPLDWPNPGHWSGLVGAVHNDHVSFFQEAQPASEGIRLMAERGQQGPLLDEVAPAIQAGTAQFGLQGGGINPTPGSTRLAFPAPMRRDFPLVTLCSMVAPSPDWFVGVSSLSLIQDGEWAREVAVPLFALDAGTDSGPTFRSPDQVTVPRGVITRLTVPPISEDGTFVPFGTFTFRRLD